MQEVRARVERVGCHVDDLDDKWFLIPCVYGDETFRILEEYLPDLPAQAEVICQNTPNLLMKWQKRLPPVEQTDRAVFEANWIATHYRNGLGDASLPGPGGERAHVPVRNKHVADIWLPMLARIQNPDSGLYPALSAIPSGMYVCNVMTLWRHSIMTTMAIFKP